jgi:hypothetical protein
MWLLLLEMLLALGLLVLIVAWTMSGRRRVSGPAAPAADERPTAAARDDDRPGPG